MRFKFPISRSDMNSSHVVLPLVIGAFGSVLGAAAGFWLMATALTGGGWSARQRLRVERHGPDEE